MKFKGMVTIFRNENGPLVFETKRVETGNKRDVLKAVRAIMDEAMKLDNLHNIQVTITQV